MGASILILFLLSIADSGLWSVIRLNYRMAQPTKWVPAILDYMKKAKLNISTMVLALISNYDS